MDPVYAPPRRARASRDDYRRVTPEDDQAMQAVSAALYQPPSTHHPNVPPNDQLAAYADVADAHRVYAGKRMREGGEMVGDDDAGVFKASGSLTRDRGGGYGSAPPLAYDAGLLGSARMLYSIKESIARQPAQRCGVDGCEFQTKLKSSLKRHQALKHGIGDVDAEELRRKRREYDARKPTQRCGVDGCEFQTKHTSDLKDHQARVHGIGDVEVDELRRTEMERKARQPVQRCGVDGCEYQTKDKSNFKRHQALVHGIGDVDADELRRKDRERMTRQPVQRCGVDGCEYETKYKQHLKQHQARAHGIELTSAKRRHSSPSLPAPPPPAAPAPPQPPSWRLCATPGCAFRALSEWEMAEHAEDVHDDMDI
jgi:hypothetical protein